MRKSKGFTIETFIEVDGEAIPLLTIDKDGNVTKHIADKDRRMHEENMMKNLGEVMSLYYSAHPET